MRRIVGLIAVSMAFVVAIAFAGCSSGAASGSSGSASSAASGSSGSASSAVSESSGSASSAEASTASSAAEAKLANGEYVVAVKTDSSMFHVNEADNGTGVLTVTDEGMTVHIHLASKKITNLYGGTAEQAKANSDALLQPTTDKVTYSDGYEEEVYGFDIPVPALDEEFDVAIIGEKGTWYDHKVTVFSPEE